MGVVKSGELKEVYAKALRVFGGESQMDTCVEECAELIKALMKHRRDEASSEQLHKDVIDEIVDVRIMVEQMSQLFGEEEVAKRFNFKIKRLVKLVNSFEEIPYG